MIRQKTEEKPKETKKRKRGENRTETMPETQEDRSQKQTKTHRSQRTQKHVHTNRQKIPFSSKDLEVKKQSNLHAYFKFKVKKPSVAAENEQPTGDNIDLDSSKLIIVKNKSKTDPWGPSQGGYKYC